MRNEVLVGLLKRRMGDSRERLKFLSMRSPIIRARPALAVPQWCSLIPLQASSQDALPAHCLVTPGGRGLVWALARAQPPTQPPIDPPTHPTLPPPWSMPSTHSQSRTDQQKFTTNGVGTQDLENRVQRYNQISY